MRKEFTTYHANSALYLHLDLVHAKQIEQLNSKSQRRSALYVEELMLVLFSSPQTLFS